MACLAMFNPEQYQGLYGPMSPRISFSNDFVVDADHAIKRERAAPSAAPNSSDFEFSKTDYTMIAADEIFSKGRLLPLKENYCTSSSTTGTQLQKTTTTLRDELLNGDDDWDDNAGVPYQRPPKGPSTRWKELLGLKKTNFSGKKQQDMRKDGSTLETTTAKCHVSDQLVAGHLSKETQEIEIANEGTGTRSGDVEIET